MVNTDTKSTLVSKVINRGKPIFKGVDDIDFIGKTVLGNDLVEAFKATEGSINMYYGKIGNGKTYSATSDILNLLKQGKVVYANWHIIVDDFDDRKSLFMILMNIVLFRKRFYKIPRQKNLRYFDPDNFNTTSEMVEWLSNLTDCHVFFDEGQDMFDSYEGTKFAKSKRRLILHTRHYHRTLNIISQRPTAIQVSARGNVNRFFKCVKLASWPWIRFARYEFQSMKGETVDEEAEPDSVKTYWGNPLVFNAYNTSYLAQGIAKSQKVFFEAYDLSFKDKILALLYKIKVLKEPTPWYKLVPQERCMPTYSRQFLYKWDPGLSTVVNIKSINTNKHILEFSTVSKK